MNTVNSLFSQVFNLYKCIFKMLTYIRNCVEEMHCIFHRCRFCVVSRTAKFICHGHQKYICLFINIYFEHILKESARYLILFRKCTLNTTSSLLESGSSNYMEIYGCGKKTNKVTQVFDWLKIEVIYQTSYTQKIFEMVAFSVLLLLQKLPNFCIFPLTTIIKVPILLKLPLTKLTWEPNLFILDIF